MMPRRPRLRVSRYPCELSSGVNPFAGGYFEHREWPVRKATERHTSPCPLYEYEANYINSTGYWLVFDEEALALRDEALTEKDDPNPLRMDVWGRRHLYALRALGLRVEFYKRSAKDPLHAKLVMPVLEGSNDVAATDDLENVLDKLDSHMAMQLMEAAASLHATREVKRSGGDAAGSQ
jgi:hypothetical protein